MPKQPDNTSKKQAPERNEQGQLLPGHTANPNGRPPKGYSITETMRGMLSAEPKIKDALSKKVLEMALKGDLTAIKMLWQYMDGMPKQEIEQTVTDSSELQLLRDIIKNGKPDELIQTKQSTD